MDDSLPGAREVQTGAVLVLAHVFPRALDDSMGAFLLHLADALPAGMRTEVVAPHAAGLGDEETIGRARVHRFHYAPSRWERLAYAGTMHEMVAGSLTNKLLFLLFISAFLARTLRAARMSRPNVLHAHWWLPDGLVGALASLLTRVPLVVTTHGTDVEMLRRTRWARPLARFVFGRARAITCGSTYLHEQLVELGAADAARVSVVPMPVGPEFGVQSPKETFRSQTFENRAANSVLTVARLTTQKSIDTLLDAMAQLRERGCTARLTIIGDGPERAALEQRARELALGEYVEFLGALAQQELPRHYAAATVFVLPSMREGMGLVFVEALLCGTPVIGTRSGGIPDIVKDGETGLLVPERDPTALANAIQKMLDEPNLARQLAENGRAWAQAHYTGAPVARQFAQLYANVRTVIV